MIWSSVTAEPADGSDAEQVAADEDGAEVQQHERDHPLLPAAGRTRRLGGLRGAETEPVTAQPRALRSAPPPSARHVEHGDQHCPGQ
jgi:hypothetical protein